MKHISTLLMVLLINGMVAGQSVTELLMPKYISVYASRLPYVCRLKLNNLSPNSTYRYYNRFVTTTNAGDPNLGGDGHHVLLKSGAFVRVIPVSLSTASRYGEFTTDATGSYSGWFMCDPSSSNTFDPGNEVLMRISLNDGNGGSSVELRLTTSSPIKVLNFGTGPGDGSAIRSTPATNGVARNFVMLFDDPAATQPVAGTWIESDGTANTTGNSYPEFYASNVDAVDKAWGTIIPNTLPNGIKKIVHYSFADGSIQGSRTSTDGSWSQDGGGRVLTINPDRGVDNPFVLNGNVVHLGAPGKLDQQIVFGPLTAVQYGVTPLTPTASTSSLLPVTFSSSNPAVAVVENGTTIKIVGAGNTNITANQVGDEDFNAAPGVAQSLAVSKASLQIKADDQRIVQGDPLPVLTVTYTGFVYTDNADSLTTPPGVTTTGGPTSAPGAYPITASGAVSANYEITYQSGILTITSDKQPQTISFPPFTAKRYGNADFDPGAASNSQLAISYSSSDLAVATIVSGKIHITGVGQTTITASQPGDVNWEAAAAVPQTLTVNKAPLTITAANKTKLAGQPNPPLTITYNGFVNQEDPAVFTTQPVISTTAITSSIPGDYPITVSGTTAANYELTHVNGVLTVSPLPSQSISFDPFSVKKYGDALFAAGAMASSGLPVSYQSSNTNVALIEGENIRIKGAGSAIITASQPGDATHAPATAVPQTLTVRKILLTASADNKERAEGQTNPALTISYSGFAYQEDASVLITPAVVTTAATAASLVGAYTINISGATAANYDILQVAGTLTVLPATGRGQQAISAWCSSPGMLQVNIYVDTSQQAVIQLFDPYGARLLHVNVTLSKGANSFRLPVGNTAAGIYYLKVIAKHFTRKEKVSIR